MNDKTFIPLTANQIKILDELEADRIGADTTLKIAMVHHSNRTNELHKRGREIWDDLIVTYRLDPDVAYVVKRVSGIFGVVPDDRTLEGGK
jgi:hypothetical protein